MTSVDFATPPSPTSSNRGGPLDAQAEPCNLAGRPAWSGVPLLAGAKA